MDHQFLVAFSFVLGYVVGSLDSIRRMIMRNVKSELTGSISSTSFVSEVSREEKQIAKTKKKITIDESKFVTDIATDDMQSKSPSPLGVVTQSSDDISSATNKLAQLKKMKG